MRICESFPTRVRVMRPSSSGAGQNGNPRMSTMPQLPEAARAARRPTLDEIARAASVSVATVSKVLNDRPGVSTITRARVLETMRAHGYSKRGGSPEYASLIELVFGSLDGEWAIELVRGAARVASESGIAITVTESGHHHSVAPDWVKGVVRRQPAGVILVASDMPLSDKYQLRAHGIPFVIVDPAGDPAPDVPSVGSTNWAGGIAATRHIIELGHTRIGVIAGPDDLMATRARVAGYRSAMEEAGLQVDESLILSGDFGAEASPDPALRLLSRPDRPTAIFATSDVKALGVYEAARSLGIGIPAQLSVVGYDDLQFARWAGPALTTVRQPLADMAQEATKLIVRLRQEPSRRADRVELATTLIVRGSTRQLS